MLYGRGTSILGDDHADCVLPASLNTRPYVNLRPNVCVLFTRILYLGRALGVCPDAIRSHVRITHALRCFEAFEGSESGHQNPRFFEWAL